MQPPPDLPASEPLAAVLSPDGQGAAPLPQLKDLQTRFLDPFVFERHQFDDVAKAVRAVTIATRQGESTPLWKCAEPHRLYSEPHHLYKDELLDHVVSFLFPDVGAKGCGYFKVADAVANKWVHGTEVPLSGGVRMPVEIVPGPLIELFLSPQGVGVLSIALTPAKDGLSLDEALDFNYRVAQFRRRPITRFRKRHPSDDPPAYARLSPEQQAGIPLAPAEDAPLDQRLGAPGGSFDLTELIGLVLGPLERFGMPPLRPKHQELLVYTVARFGPEVYFADPVIRDRLAPLLAALAQVEEPGHPGTAAADLSLANGVLNTRHWAAVGLLGAAHLVADQPGDVAFNEQRMAIVRDKYFIPYLVALLQRLALNRAIAEAGRIVAARGEDAAARLERLRAGLLEFGVGGHFTQVSARQALHRSYRIARAGLDVPEAWAEVRRAIADLDAQVAAAGQARLARTAARDLAVVTRLQEFLHVIEFLIVSVYHAHLWHMFAAENEPLKRWAGRALGLDGDWFVSLGVLASAFIGLGVAALLNRLLGRIVGGHGPSPIGAGPPAPAGGEEG